ncbi:MAG TPA: GxxExxY protein, partial [Chitinophagales bacterium]|nr:GxxExxY protein [Chitinophagales bacterium]
MNALNKNCRYEYLAFNKKVVFLEDIKSVVKIFRLIEDEPYYRNDLIEIIYKDESFLVYGAIFEVYKELGSGFLEAVYQECLSREFVRQKIPFTA